ncbi:MAG TPA: hypothetical protein VME19_20240 [Streptosporangiaceae bacterium]|nr:hypothetical protein [Streptosporangiaceae bacterium]
MNVVSDLDLPAFGYMAPDFSADVYHQHLAEIRRLGWLLAFGAGLHYCLGANLARAELEEALAFPAPRTQGLALDGPPQLGGVEGSYGTDKLPIIWSAPRRT